MIVADVQAVGTFLRFAPRRGADLTGVLRALRGKSAPGTVRRDGSALMAPAREMTWLLDNGEAEGLGVALDAEALRALVVRRRAAMVHQEYRDHVGRLRASGSRPKAGMTYFSTSTPIGASWPANVGSARAQ
ncbi:MAG: hypothetical protein ACLQLO_03685 [Mycobacterium sp.]